MFSSAAGIRAVKTIGSEPHALDLVSWISVEVLFEYLSHSREGSALGSPKGRRFLSVPGEPAESPILAVLDPGIETIRNSRSLTREVDADVEGLMSAFLRLRPLLLELEDRELAKYLGALEPAEALQLLWIAHPEVVLTRLPRMTPLCAPTPFLEVLCGPRRSSAGILCRDSDGAIGITASLHGTGPAGTVVTLAGRVATVKSAHEIQDIAFIPLPPDLVVPHNRGRHGVRSDRAPSEAEGVTFEGAGSRALVRTHVRSHDAGLLRPRPSLQLKVQTPADANNGDSGSALVDASDQVLAFAYERSALGDYPELTDWIWAANALASLGLTPIP